MAGRLLLITIALAIIAGLALPDVPGNAPAPTIAPAESSASPPPTLQPLDTAIVRAPDGHFYVDALVDGQRVHFLIDTGASLVALTSEDARRVGLNFSPAEFTPIGRGASGEVSGKPITLDRITIAGAEARQIPAAIVGDGLGVSLLGQSFLSRLGSVSIDGDRMTLR